MRLQGPFDRGLWEFCITGACANGSAYDRIRMYYPVDGQLSEGASFAFAGLPATQTTIKLRFWLTRRADWLRFDPTERPGTIMLQAIRARRRPLVTALPVALAGALIAAPRSTAALLRAAIVRRKLDQSERRRLVELIAPSAPSQPERWLEHRMRTRGTSYTASRETGLFSLLTTVYDTPAPFIHELASSIQRQSWTDFEWLVLDNGSRSRETKRALARLGRDTRVKQFRTAENLGIIGGMRYVLERAVGRYVLPVDSDDWLTPDALQVIASVAQSRGYPALLYSDEDKLQAGTHCDPFLKPDWDPVLLRNCCYIAHLCAIDRELAAALGAYLDKGAEGCHDWDTFMRFFRAGYSAEHVPEVLYSWRMHGGSTAAHSTAKDYIVRSQRHVLTNHLRLSGAELTLDLQQSPFFPASPDWWIRRRRLDAQPAVVLAEQDSPSQFPAHLTGGFPIAEVTVMPGNAGQTALQVRRALQALSDRRAGMIVLLGSGVMPLNDEWLWEMAGLKEAFPDAGVIGGRLIDEHDIVICGAGILGTHASWDSPDRGRHRSDGGYFGTALKQRSTSVVASSLCAVDADLLGAVASDGVTTLASLSVPLALAAFARGRRVIYSPFIEGRFAGQNPPVTSLHEPVSDRRYYHKLLSTNPARFFTPTTSGNE